MLTRIQRKRQKGWRKDPPDAVWAGRPGRWGNPHDFRVLGRPEAVARYRRDLFAGLLDFSVDDVRRELRGRVLMCYCPLDEPCHADTLFEIANKEPAV